MAGKRPRKRIGERVTPLEMAQRLVAFDTVSSKPNRPLIEAVKAYLDCWGVGWRETETHAGAKANLFITIPAVDGNTTEGGVVLSGHSDVVPVEGQPWSSDPFRPEIRDGRLYGRGTADMKSFVAVALAKVPVFLEAGLRRPIHIAISHDEEIGCIGVRPLVEDIVAAGIRPRLALVGEPTEMRIVNGHKGARQLRTVIVGKAAHSSAPHSGVNAIQAAARLIGEIERIGEALASAPPAPALDLDPPHTTLNVGLINGGVAPNVIADRCEFAWDHRATPLDDPEDVYRAYEAVVARDIRPMLETKGGRIDTELVCDVPPLRPMEGNPAETLARRLTGANRTEMVSYCSEAGIFQAAGIPSVLCGPGNIREAHQADEYVALSEIEACAAFMDRLAAAESDLSLSERFGGG